MKKGILFTLGLTFLILVILSAALLIFHNAQKSEEIIAKLAVVDRVYELDTSIGQGLKDIFHLKAGISIEFSANSISFEESLPNNNLREFNASMHQFKRFIESNFSNINLTIDEITAQLPLSIMPYDITYQRPNLNAKKIAVIPAQLNFNGYSILIAVPENVTLCSWDLEEGSFDVSAEIMDPSGLACSVSEEIEPSEDNKIEINGGLIVIEIKDNILSIEIDEDSQITATVKTAILADTTNAYIEYSLPTTRISFTELGVYKESKAKLYSKH